MVSFTRVSLPVSFVRSVFCFITVSVRTSFFTDSESVFTGWLLVLSGFVLTKAKLSVTVFFVNESDPSFFCCFVNESVPVFFCIKESAASFACCIESCRAISFLLISRASYKSVSRAENNVSAVIYIESLSCLMIINGLLVARVLSFLLSLIIIPAMMVVPCAESTTTAFPVMVVIPDSSSLLILLAVYFLGPSLIIGLCPNSAFPLARS